MRPSVRLPRDDVEDAARKSKKEGTGGSSWRAHADTDMTLEEGELHGDDADEVLEEAEVELVPIPAGICSASVGHPAGPKHFACAKCLPQMQECPRCKHAITAMNYDIPGVVRYCTHINNGGFVGSSKINAVVDWAKSVPESDKVRQLRLAVFATILCSSYCFLIFFLNFHVFRLSDAGFVLLQGWAGPSGGDLCRGPRDGRCAIRRGFASRQLHYGI